VKLLFCCQSYYPSRGGVQEVMRQIAERLVAAGHDVSVATRRQSDRTSNLHNGVRIHEFDVNGNLAQGLRGEVQRYQDFVKNFEADAILIKAAQQWSFDALWPVLDDVKARKVFVPCGFSGFYEPEYVDYFAQLPDVLRKFDHLIFYAEKYRDIDFAKAHGITTFSIIPNGASENEFDRAGEGSLRAKLGIPADDFLFLTVGSPVVAKGQKEVGEAFAEMDLGARNATLILNGDWPELYLDSAPVQAARRPFVPGWLSNTLEKLRVLADMASSVAPRLIRPNSIVKGLVFLYRKGWRAAWDRLFPEPPGVPDGPEPPRFAAPDAADADRAVKEVSGGKRILCLNMPREDVISAFLEADLFVFASKVEYSPLVLFEAAAAGTPFLTVPAGNSSEIVRWTGGGWICPAEVDERGYTRVSPAVLAREMEKAIRSPELLRQLGAAGRQAWLDRFTWTKITKSYERILRGETAMSPLQSDAAE
jgi:glycosyltransferase involved in cell wall biosynthesis